MCMCPPHLIASLLFEATPLRKVTDLQMASFKESAQSLLSEVAGVLLRRSSGGSKDEPDSVRYQEVCHGADPDVGMMPDG